MRQKREERKGRNRRLSSRKQRTSGRKKAKTAGVRKSTERSESGKKLSPEKPESESQKARVSQKKHLQRLKLAEDERKLQTKRFVKQCEWKPKGGNHRFV